VRASALRVLAFVEATARDAHDLAVPASTAEACAS
jgi:hypothetical protein